MRFVTDDGISYKCLTSHFCQPLRFEFSLSTDTAVWIGFVVYASIEVIHSLRSTTFVWHNSRRSLLEWIHMSSFCFNSTTRQVVQDVKNNWNVLSRCCWIKFNVRLWVSVAFRIGGFPLRMLSIFAVEHETI